MENRFSRKKSNPPPTDRTQIYGAGVVMKNAYCTHIKSMIKGK